ncbi:Uncharacterized protein APZ42_029715 [Daphnia magna]|uniref:Uncharacterized protein n=1 Tax=Daphnia magna TaxID=35525 RepID=A0A164PDL5_9CRUS|nr:Uncharacterized protein APZ42_029715 [Daphnia magna]
MTKHVFSYITNKQNWKTATITTKNNLKFRRRPRGFIDKSLLPLSIVDDPNFVAFVKCIDARKGFPCRNTITYNYHPALYEEARLKLIHELERVDYVALTTDCWTSLNNYSYLTVTAHYINPKMKRVSRVLKTVHMENNHTADNLRNELFSIVDRWGIRNKIVGVVTDNTANIKKAVFIIRLSGRVQPHPY